jgi:hypothetical protein
MISGRNEKRDAAVLPVIWPWFAIIGVIIAAAVIRWQLLSVPFERDEGEYAYIAQQMLQGVPPYVSAYSMKLPGIYAVYALIMAVFGQTYTAVHLGLLIFNAATIFIVFIVARKVFGPLAGVMAGGVFAAISLTSEVSGLWANAEHFVILPALAGLLLIYNIEGKNRYFKLITAGLLLGFAFVIKQHGIFFAVFAALYLLYSGLRRKPIVWRSIIISQIVLAAGALIPFAGVCLIFWHNGTFDKFWYWTFTYAREYTAVLSLTDAWGSLNYAIWPIVKESYLIWLIAIAGLSGVIILKQYRQRAVFVIGVFIFSFLAVCPGYYFRGHYFIFILPALAILAGAGLCVIDILLQKATPVILRIVITGTIGLIVIGHTLYTQRQSLFELLPEDVCRKAYTANPFPESLRIAEFIRNYSEPNDTLAVIGSEPQIYFYACRRSATSYIYMYPLMEANPRSKRMQQDMISQIEKARPKFMVFVTVVTSWLPQPGSSEFIFDWFETYIKDSYDRVGLIDIPMTGRAVYYWNNQAKSSSPTSECWIAVLKKRE